METYTDHKYEQELFVNPDEFQEDTATWLAEVLDGQMRTEVSFLFDGEELYSQDGRPIHNIFADSIEAAEELAQAQPNLAFEHRRRMVEMEEYAQMVEIAKGSRGNTMVVVSDFPEELEDSPEDVGGYNVSRKQTMLRVISRKQDGTISVVTQSLDGSDREGLEAIYHHFGLQPEPGELLGQRITWDNLGPWEQETLADTLREKYDQKLSENYGGAWFAGRSLSHDFSVLNTYEFVREQTDLMGWIGAHVQGGKEDLDKFLYSVAATMKARYEDMLAGKPERIPVFSGNVYPINLEAEIRLAMREAASNGQAFSGCGMTVGSELSGEEDMAGLGYGNKTNKETKYEFNKHMHCVVCQAPPKEDESKKMCGPCGICRDCDKKL